MNIAKLQPNTEIKNYQALCDLLEVKPTGGEAKKLLLANLARQVDYTLEGRKFLIHNIKDRPNMKEPRKNNIWVKTTIRSLLSYLSQFAPDDTESTTIVFVESYKLTIALGFCNEEYYFNRKKYMEEAKQTIETYFYDTTSYTMRNAIKGILSYMRLHYGQRTELEAYSYNLIGSTESVIASSDMVRKIDFIYLDEARKLGYETIAQTFKSSRRTEYYTNVNNRLKAEYGVIKIRKGLAFEFNYLIKEQLRWVDEDLARLEKSQTNKKMIEVLSTKGREFCESLFLMSSFSAKEKRVVSREEQIEDLCTRLQGLIMDSVSLDIDDLNQPTTENNNE